MTGTGEQLPYDWHRQVQEDSDAVLVEARAGLDDLVPGCPGWQVRELVGHLGTVHRFHASHLGRGVDSPPDLPRPTPPADDEELLEWFDAGYRALLVELSRTEPDAPAWTLSPYAPRTSAFWRRRMAQETSVHRWDVQSAHDDAVGFDLTVADDGIDEMLLVLRPASLAGAAAPGDRNGTVLVRTTDSAAQWAMRLDGSALTPLDPVPASADAVLAGTASAVLLALWGRVPLAELEIDGDRSLLLAALRDGPRL